MNKQKAPKGIEWARVYGRDGFTWNPTSGCHHGCEWLMPDGATAQCYAKSQAESPRLEKFYPQGFNHHYFHPKRLKEPLSVKIPSGIFLGSMADVFAHNVPEYQIEQILDVCRQASQHIFFILTKNPVRLKHFSFPQNVWVGASSPPDIYMGKVLTTQKKEAMLTTALKSLSELDNITWMSFEPLSNDYSDILKQYPLALNWAVIGAASQGRKYIPPNLDDFQNTMGVLDRQGVSIFFKGNLRSLKEAAMNWREEFPATMEFFKGD